MYGSTTSSFRVGGLPSTAVGLELSTSNYLAGLHLSTRLQEQTGRFRPYLELLGGVKYLFTYSSVSADRGFNDYQLSGATNYDSVALSWGGGAGIDLTVFMGGMDGSIRQIDLNVGVQYLRGSPAEYLQEGRIVDENRNGRLEREELPISKSRTTHLQPQIGVTFRLR
jgi:hypothetical protein